MMALIPLVGNITTPKKSKIKKVKKYTLFSIITYIYRENELNLPINFKIICSNSFNLFVPKAQYIRILIIPI